MLPRARHRRTGDVLTAIDIALGVIAAPLNFETDQREAEPPEETETDQPNPDRYSKFNSLPDVGDMSTLAQSLR